MRRFAGITLITDRIPDETTILAFRQRLEENDLGRQIFEAVKAHLKANGMAMKQGTIIDIGMDSKSGLIHSVETTAANVHDLPPAAELLHGEETAV